MQSVCMKEARTGGAHRLAEETTLVQLIFGGYLRSKVLFTKHLRFVILYIQLPEIAFSIFLLTVSLCFCFFRR
jgi:hypothetical protein